MTHQASELLEKALALPDKERAELAASLISSLDVAVDEDTDAAWQHEIVRRFQEVQTGQVETVPWEDVQRKGSALLHDE
jgi:putative addiction module component (TIGR02574 family)